MQRKTIGILGGMGPAATAELFNIIIDNTIAETDQDHISTIVINDPQVPDRTKFILGEGKSPVPKLLENLKKLYLIGADVAIIPCMTAHSFLPELQKQSPIQIINTMELVERYISEHYPSLTRVGLLATTGSIKSGVYNRYLTRQILTPTADEQRNLMNIIYGYDGIKAGNVTAATTFEVERIIDTLRRNDIHGVIAGCTELSLVLHEKSVQLPIIDPIKILAKEAVRLGSANLFANI
ncbi:amino acid racemase [Bacillus sp. H-16]|uniref:aspartate/glutamate racemase family protein n=1 Tax=Alteribacter salitolerans TaxID=2912333 RepID=UPI001965AE4B|nr:amino acid racemase [Alteribacter salitolerans]MBM7095819.1 amino acid racemase [Alteribacter salitolerans]